MHRLVPAVNHESVTHRLKHFGYSAGWKTFERAWDLVIRIKQLSQMRPLLEAVLAPVAPDAHRVTERSAFGERSCDARPAGGHAE